MRPGRSRLGPADQVRYPRRRRLNPSVKPAENRSPPSNLPPSSSLRRDKESSENRQGSHQETTLQHEVKILKSEKLLESGLVILLAPSQCDRSSLVRSIPSPPRHCDRDFQCPSAGSRTRVHLDSPRGRADPSRNVATLDDRFARVLVVGDGFPQPTPSAPSDSYLWTDTILEANSVERNANRPPKEAAASESGSQSRVHCAGPIRRLDRRSRGTPSGTISVDALICDPRFFLARSEMRSSALTSPQVPARIR